MPSSRDDHTGRRLLRTLAVVAAIAGSALLPATAAVADEPASTTVVGELVQAYAEAEGHEAEAAPVSWVETASGEAVPVASGDVAEVPAGSTVSVTLGDEKTEDGGTAHPVLGTEVLEAPATAPALAGPLTNQVTVAMVAPAGTPTTGTRATRQQVVDLVDGPVAQFWAEETGGAVALGVTASSDWITTTASCAKAAVLWNEVAAKVHFVPGPGKHLLLYVPPNAPGCAYALAEVGSSLASGGRLYVRDAVPSVIAHELGHNFGLAHSSGEQCEATLDGGHCRTVGYRDYYDVMGVSWAQTGSLNVVQAAALGVLPRAQVLPVSVHGQGGSVTLAPVSGRSGVRALRLTDASGVDYWLEYRPAAGRDAWLGTSANSFALDTGVLLRRSDRFPDTSVLLDGTPSRATGWDTDLQTALSVGTPVTVADGQFTIRLDEITADGALVSVVPTAPTAASGAPAPAPAPAAPSSGTVLSGGDDPAAASTGESPAAGASPQDPSTGVAAPDLTPLSGAAAQPQLVAAAESSDHSNGLVLAGLGSTLAGATLLVVRKFRRVVRR